MKSRREFVRQVSKSAALSTIAFSSVSALALGGIANSEENLKPLIIGVIGAENTHTINFGKMFNIDKKFPGVELKYVWGETEEFAIRAKEKGQIPNIINDPVEMLGKIDALIVDHRHPKYHLEAAMPFVKAGIPAFVDKPFCYRVEEGKKFLAMAREIGTPVTSFSPIANSDATYDIKQQLKAMGEINHVVSCGPVDLDSKYGGVFFYGVHIIQPLLVLFGDDVHRVRITRKGKQGSAALVFKNGLFATVIFKNVSRGWETFVETKNGFVELKSRVEERDPGKMYIDMIEMFRTGKEPRSHDSILKCVAILEALEQSSLSEDWVEVKV